MRLIFEIEKYERNAWLIVVRRRGWGSAYRWIADGLTLEYRTKVREKARRFFRDLAHAARGRGPRNARQRRRRLLRSGNLPPLVNGNPDEVRSVSDHVENAYRSMWAALVETTPFPEAVPIQIDPEPTRPLTVESLRRAREVLESSDARDALVNGAVLTVNGSIFETTGNRNTTERDRIYYSQPLDSDSWSGTFTQQRDDDISF